QRNPGCELDHRSRRRAYRRGRHARRTARGGRPVLVASQSPAARGIDRIRYRLGSNGRNGHSRIELRMNRLERADAPSTLTHATDSRVAALEAQLKEATVEIAELRARDALKTQFLANISHDLRTPLTAVITHAEILRDGILGELAPRQMESVRGIISGGRQLLNQVGEILTYARGAANQLTLVS